MIKTTLGQTADYETSIVSDASDPDRLVFVTEQDVSPVLEHVAMRREVGGFDKDMKPVAEIPMVVVQQMMRDGSWNDPAAIKRWLNDPQNSCFRIWQGRV